MRALCLGIELASWLMCRAIVRSIGYFASSVNRALHKFVVAQECEEGVGGAFCCKRNSRWHFSPTNMKRKAHALEQTAGANGGNAGPTRQPPSRNGGLAADLQQQRRAAGAAGPGPSSTAVAMKAQQQLQQRGLPWGSRGKPQSNLKRAMQKEQEEEEDEEEDGSMDEDKAEAGDDGAESEEGDEGLSSDDSKGLEGGEGGSEDGDEFHGEGEMDSETFEETLQRKVREEGVACLAWVLGV